MADSAKFHKLRLRPQHRITINKTVDKQQDIRSLIIVVVFHDGILVDHQKLVAVTLSSEKSTIFT